MATPSPAPGQQLSHYRLVEAIGAGGMGVVFRAHDEQLNRDVALKVLPPATFDDPAARARLLQEARSAAALNHPHICTIHEVGESQGQMYIAMELVEGETLSHKLISGPLPLDRVLECGVQLADALAHAHQRGIVHRDLKSGNVVINQQGRAKVLDFGLAKRLSSQALDEVTRSRESLTAPGALVGTIPYMAPEQLRGHAADTRSDVWALGVVLFEAATGELPFKGQTGFELSSAILEKPPAALPARVPLELRSIIGRCLEKSPERRYQSSGELHAALQSVQAGATVPWAAWRYQMARRRWLTAAVAALLLISVAALMNVDRLRRFFGGAPRILTIAVLPLQNLSGDAEQEYLADGVQEALITDLARLKGFQRVIARSSVMSYRKSDKPLAQIARELGVDAIVTGAVLRSGNRVRITAQLVSGATEENLWAERYDREMRDVLTLQNEIVAAITRQIRLQLTPGEEKRLATRRAVDPEAYELYLRGKFYVAQLTPDGIEKGLKLLHQAVEKDPNNPRAYADLALAYSEIGHAVMPDNFARAKAAALKALELDPENAEAYEALAELKLYQDWDDWSGTRQAFLKALEMNPNLASALRNYGWFLHLEGKTAEGLRMTQRARDIDPLNTMYAVDLGWQYWDAGEPDKAIAEARSALEINADFPFAHLLLSLVYSSEGRHDEALKAAQAAAANPGFLWAVGVVHAAAGRKSDARQIANELKKRGSAMDCWGLAEIHAILGEHDEALFWLERAYELRFSWLPWLVQTDAGLQRPFRPFANHSRYQALLRKMNLAK